jgi:hypothetical protein
MKSVFGEYGLFIDELNFIRIYMSILKEGKKGKLFYTDVSHYKCNQLVFN